jgi:hypothetical protein
VLPEDVVDIPVLPPDALADDVVPANVGANELPELGLPLPLQPWQPDAVAGAFSGRSRSCIGSICHRRPMRLSSSAPSGIGETA